MPHRVLRHLRANAIAYAALFLSISGTSVAAVALANHSIDPVKLNPRYIGGYVRGWVSVNAQGHIVASAGGSKMIPLGDTPGHYAISWRPFPTSSCVATGSVDVGNSATSVPGYVVTQTSGIKRSEETSVTTFGVQGQPQPLPFDVLLVCRTPR